ncbi:hypothetical protein AQUCO_00900372v1 [Aquilegia coerulea]|uniref:Uncharacterized protein n=1 Tax=Aquilegia coerulea TaxID=218851 RepID=A0A2G5EDG3_AQUCA|nr:hypothetical protein AQUCO_00900372v1 [Aquilegia coerulea]
MVSMTIVVKIIDQGKKAKRCKKGYDSFDVKADRLEPPLAPILREICHGKRITFLSFLMYIAVLLVSVLVL